MIEQDIWDDNTFTIGRKRRNSKMTYEQIEDGKAFFGNRIAGTEYVAITAGGWGKGLTIEQACKNATSWGWSTWDDDGIYGVHRVMIYNTIIDTAYMGNMGGLRIEPICEKSWNDIWGKLHPLRDNKIINFKLYKGDEE